MSADPRIDALGDDRAKPRPAWEYSRGDVVRAMRAYVKSLDNLVANDPAGARVVRGYIRELRNECAHHRAVAAQLRAKLADVDPRG